MIGLFLVTHGTLGESLVQGLCHVLHERPPQVAQFGLAAGDDPDALLPLARQMLHLVDDGDGVLLMSDIFGATPSNLALKLLEPGRVEGLTGVNLPMLLRSYQVSRSADFQIPHGYFKSGPKLSKFLDCQKPFLSFLCKRLIAPECKVSIRKPV